MPFSEQALADLPGHIPSDHDEWEYTVMRFLLLLALVLTTGGFLGSTAYKSGEELSLMSLPHVLAVGESATVIVALLLPSLLLLIAVTARGAARLVLR